MSKNKVKKMIVECKEELRIMKIRLNVEKQPNIIAIYVENIKSLELEIIYLEYMLEYINKKIQNALESVFPEGLFESSFIKSKIRKAK